MFQKIKSYLSEVSQGIWSGIKGVACRFGNWAKSYPGRVVGRLFWQFENAYSLLEEPCQTVIENIKKTGNWREAIAGIVVDSLLLAPRMGLGILNVPMTFTWRAAFVFTGIELFRAVPDTAIQQLMHFVATYEEAFMWLEAANTKFWGAVLSFVMFTFDHFFMPDAAEVAVAGHSAAVDSLNDLVREMAQERHEEDVKKHGKEKLQRARKLQKEYREHVGMSLNLDAALAIIEAHDKVGKEVA